MWTGKEGLGNRGWTGGQERNQSQVESLLQGKRGKAAYILNDKKKPGIRALACALECTWSPQSSYPDCPEQRFMSTSTTMMLAQFFRVLLRLQIFPLHILSENVFFYEVVLAVV
ncbi:hypothetical protein llap_1271 [Limosa lapponica baueri]|uniref:Uncharacterized protein n=1 Tax=Limosa lapponica baueri TaxID=1758121 RepID=A0A2I0UQX0_LIMLA|nr:hypothetical protein llap_1271 [Limosa lapponica baueri]